MYWPMADLLMVISYWDPPASLSMSLLLCVHLLTCQPRVFSGIVPRGTGVGPTWHRVPQRDRRELAGVPRAALEETTVVWWAVPVHA